MCDPLRERRGRAQVNRPTPIWAGIGGSPASEALVQLQQGIGRFGHGTKGGPPWTHSTAQTVAKQPRIGGLLCRVWAAMYHWPLLMPKWSTCEPG